MSESALYSISSEYLKVLNAIDEDNNDETIKSVLSDIKEDLDMKIIAVSSYIKNCESRINEIKKAEANMYKRRHSLTKKTNRLKDYLCHWMTECGVASVESPQLDVKIKVNPPKVVVDDEEKVPLDYFEFKTETIMNLNKMKNDMKFGLYIEGAHLEQTQRVEIK